MYLLEASNEHYAGPVWFPGEAEVYGQGRLRVLIAEESRLVAEALMFALDSDPMLEAIGYGLDGWEALELAATHEPDVVLVGAHLSGVEQFEFSRLVHELLPDALLILLCDRLVPAEVEAAYATGAADYLPTSRSADQLLHAISAARTRQSAFERGQRQAVEWRRAPRLVSAGVVHG
jgi:DNA-binding NarL/FixJ family response regulator